ncbi:MAG: GDP-mannose 4,6-dehydratase, partial [Deltaproteobacteria bacterium]|nr:GDP-mannose 4,6-dehydratase [Deltaproteobacteria bacterium]
HTHHFPSMVSRCSNNYGPYQFPEKLIPLMVTNAMTDQPLPLYGDGKNVRSWLHVDDHSHALMLILQSGRPGEVYNIGGAPESERENVDVVHQILKLTEKPTTLIRPVEDRKGHDRRYAVDFTKMNRELGWSPKVDFENGLRQTVQWYRENESWWRRVKSGEYQRFYESYYGARLQEGGSRTAH